MVAKLQGDKLAPQSSMELYYPWIDFWTPLRFQLGNPHIPWECANVAIPICPVPTRNRASGPEWEKNGQMDSGPTEKRRKKGRTMGKRPFLTHFRANFPIFSAIFLPFSWWGQNPLFAHFGPEARFRVCTGQSGSQRQRPLTLILLQKYRDTNGSCIVIQIGDAYTSVCAKKGILLQKYCDRNGRCIAILFKSIGVRGRFDSPEYHWAL